MSDAVIEITTFTFSPERAKNQEWLTKWEVIKFDWFMKLYIEWKDDDDTNIDEENTWVLPNINIWELLIWNNLNWTQTYSRPPARYTEASLVKKMESEWIGRPSTYAPTISTIIDRWYIEKIEKKYLFPTETAFVVTDFLEKYFNKLMEYKFTKNVEEDFDKIAKWDDKFQDMLKDFWENSLKKDLENAWEKAEKVIEKVWKKCPKCNEELIYRYSKAWKIIGCSGYPECDFIDQPEEEKNKIDDLKKKFEWQPCPEWWTIVVKTWRFGPFLASSDYPKVKRIWKIKDEKEEILEDLLQKKWLLIDEATWEELIIRNSKRWPFLAAKNYPKVKIAKNIPKEIWDELNVIMSENKEKTD
jgi:DNA topoisomerase-1